MPEPPRNQPNPHSHCSGILHCAMLCHAAPHSSPRLHRPSFATPRHRACLGRREKANAGLVHSFHTTRSVFILLQSLGRFRSIGIGTLLQCHGSCAIHILIAFLPFPICIFPAIFVFVFTGRRAQDPVQRIKEFLSMTLQPLILVFEHRIQLQAVF